MQMVQPNIHHLTDNTLPLFKTQTKNNIFWVVFGSILIALSSKVQIPFGPVPFTMQTYVILTLAMAMGYKLATTTLVAYLAQGAAGLPVFAKGGGLAYFVSGSGGYLIGFLIAAMAVGYLADKGFDKSIVKAVIAMIIGNVLIYIPGVAWLAYIVQDFDKALVWGLYPFVVSDLVKIILGAATLPIAWQFLGNKK